MLSFSSSLCTHSCETQDTNYQKGIIVLSCKRMTVGMAMLFIASLWSYVATAGTSVSNATILQVAPSTLAGNGTSIPFFIYLSVNDTNIGCNSGNLNAFAIDSTTEAGRTLIAVAIAARLTGQPVTVQGTGTCTVWGLTDTVSSIVL